MRKLLVLVLAALLVSSFQLCIAAEEVEEEYIEVTDPEVIESEIEKCWSSPYHHPITLTEGWNLIAMPCLPDKPYTVNRFIQQVESYEINLYTPIYKDGEEGVSQEESLNEDYDQEVEVEKRIIHPFPKWRVCSFLTYKDGRFKRISRYGPNYNMVPGEAYFVYAKYNWKYDYYLDSDEQHYEYFRFPSKTIYIRGKIPNKPVSLNLNRGWNAVSLMLGRPYIPGPIPTIGWISKQLETQNIKAKNLARWVTREQRWKMYTLPYDDFNVLRPAVEGWIPELPFNIGRGEGFFLLCEENGLFIPGLGESPYRIKRIGKVEGVYYKMFGPSPPYSYMLITGVMIPVPGLPSYRAEQIPLKGINSKIEEQLEDACADGGKYWVVKGTMITMMNYNGMPDGSEGRPVEVLLVDEVRNVRNVNATYELTSEEE